MLTTDSLVPEPTADSSVQESPAPTTLADVAPRAERSSASVDHPYEADEPRGESAERQVVDRQAALRALRNLEATEVRLERNARREIEEARGKLVQQLLPVLDNLDRTIRAAHSHRSDPAMLEGVRMVRHQLESVLRGYGVERIEALDQPFDPTLHEAIGVAPVHEPRRHGAVVHQVEPGYRFGGKLLRPAKVTVGKLAAPLAAGARPLWR
jgi:molecular chaperone GrpE (heat shock protein)